MLKYENIGPRKKIPKWRKKKIEDDFQGVGYFQASLAFQPTPPFDFVCIYLCSFYQDVFYCIVLVIKLNYYLLNYCH